MLSVRILQVPKRRYTLERFRKEQWWQLKREAYESIIRRLSDIMFSAEIFMAALETRRHSRMPRHARNTPWIFKKSYPLGDLYIVSEKTAQAVRPVLDRLASNNVSDRYIETDPYEDARGDTRQQKKALETVRSEARRELGGF